MGEATKRAPDGLGSYCEEVLGQFSYFLIGILRPETQIPVGLMVSPSMIVISL